ncbi:hypothetical protein L3X38_024305 [Prunus dulcis]|uniref:Uncharacterized protein n=1 Tax=Prunus dulcis TaxID=3755 RepID=A0AAD4W299_PRUDU|nr:hypothetical protein L3X38_024305 [Prunus dulcis]
MFNNVDLTVSSYHTAWVAMVPSPNSLKDPFFPECLNWLLGLHFIESNLASATDEEQQSPVGFDIIFPSMIESAMNLDMNLPQQGSTLDAIFQRRGFEL